MKLIEIFKYQFYLYLFILLFALQNYYFEDYNYEWIYYEYVVIAEFFLSVYVVLQSVIVLILQAIKVCNKAKIQTGEMLFLMLNLVLYYFVIYTSLFMGTIIR